MLDLIPHCHLGLMLIINKFIQSPRLVALVVFRVAYEYLGFMIHVCVSILNNWQIKRTLTKEEVKSFFDFYRENLFVYNIQDWLNYWLYPAGWARQLESEGRVVASDVTIKYAESIESNDKVIGRLEHVVDLVRLATLVSKTMWEYLGCDRLVSLHDYIQLVKKCPGVEYGNVPKFDELEGIQRGSGYWHKNGGILRHDMVQ